MTKRRSTKRALLLSALSLLMCVSMLIGSTFAWFTDSVTSAGNIIKSGKLEVTMHWADGKEAPATANWKDASQDAIFDYDLWEPGYVQVRHIKIENIGNLALKYQIGIKANGEVSDLSDVIDVYYVDPAVQVADRANLDASAKLGTLSQVLGKLSSTASGNLLAGEKHTITIALKMQETAGNEYQEKSIGTDFSVVLTATQLISENDSFDNQYDKLATVDSAEELAEALAGDYDLIVLGSNIEFADVSSFAAKPATETILIPADKDLTIDLNGYTMSQAKTQAGAYALIANKGNLTIKDSIGTGKISYEDITPYTADPGWASNTIRNEGVLNIVGGTVENITAEAVMNFGYPHAIDAYQGSVTNVTGGTVKSLNYDSIRMFCNSETLATEVNISGGTIINRISFQDPAQNRAGYGILNISGGEFVTTGKVNANVRLLNFSNVSSNMKATVTGGNFDKGFKTQDIANVGVSNTDWIAVTGGTYASDPSAFVADGYKAVVVGDKFEVIENTVTYATASTATELQAALDNAANENLIVLTADIEGDVTVKQISNLVITVNGDGHKFAGAFIVDGNSATEKTSGVTLKNMNFVADSISADACINLGESGKTSTRYTCNVTVENCHFDVPEVVGIKSYTGGDKNLTIKGCTTSEDLHSLAQLKGIDGVLVDDCTVTSVRGINFNNSVNVTVKESTIDVQKYALRYGSDANETVENFFITNCTLKSANVGGDPVIEIRAGATNANLTITNTTITGNIQMTGHENANIVIQ